MEKPHFELISSDFSNLEGTDCYCSSEAAHTIRGAVSKLPARALHLLGTGDMHYASLFWLEKLRQPFTLVLMDNHPDDQSPALGDILSCGGWVREARKLEFCRGDIWLDGEGAVHRRGEMLGAVYLSIDLDILGTDWFKANWSQGSLTLQELVSAIGTFTEGKELLGADICGGLGKRCGNLSCDLSLNEAAYDTVIGCFNG